MGGIRRDHGVSEGLGRPRGGRRNECRKRGQAYTYPRIGDASLQPGGHQWSIYWVNGADGVLEPNPMVGEFNNGRGEFYNQQVYEGKAVYARFVWTGVTSN